LTIGISSIILLIICFKRIACEPKTSSINDQKIYYDARWSEHAYINPFALKRLISILEALNATNLERPRILDLGCGTGWLSAILNEFGPTTGIELFQKAVKAARVKHPAAEFVSGSLFEISLPKNMFDIVVSQEVIEHVEDQKGYISIAAECLKEEGYLILTTPNAVNFNHWTEKELQNWNLQPIENWLTMREIKELLRPKFYILMARAIIAEFGSKGVYRIINSFKINKLLDELRLKDFKNRLALRMGLGLHSVVLARKRKGI